MIFRYKYRRLLNWVSTSIHSKKFLWELNRLRMSLSSPTLFMMRSVSPYFKIKVMKFTFHSATWNIWHYYLVLNCWMLACVCFYHKFRFLTQFYFLFNGTNTWNLVCDRSGLTAMAERKPTSAHGSLVFFNEQDAVEGKCLIGYLWHLKLVSC